MGKRSAAADIGHYFSKETKPYRLSGQSPCASSRRPWLAKHGEAVVNRAQPMRNLFKSLVLPAFLCLNVVCAEDALPGWARGFKIMTETRIPDFTIEKETKLRDAVSKLSALADKQGAAFSSIVETAAGDVVLPEIKMQHATVQDILARIASIGSRHVSLTYQRFGIQLGFAKKPATFVTGKLNPGIKVDGWAMHAVSIHGPIPQYALNPKTGEFQLLCDRSKVDPVLEWLVDTEWVTEHTVVELDWPLNGGDKLPSTLLKESPFAPPDSGPR